MGNKTKYLLGLAYTSKENILKWVKFIAELRGGREHLLNTVNQAQLSLLLWVLWVSNNPTQLILAPILLMRKIRMTAVKR